MSWHSYWSTCPLCWNECEAYNDRKPFEFTSLSCKNCGFYTEIKTGRMSLEEIIEEKMDELLNNDNLDPEDEDDKKEIDEAIKEIKETYNNVDKEMLITLWLK